MTNVLPLEILLTRLPINETTISRARFSTLLESPDLSLRQVSITQDHIADSWNANSFIWVNRDPRSSSKSLPKRHLNPFPAPITRKQNIFLLKPRTLVIACCRHWLRSTKTVRPKVSTSRCWRSCKTDRCVASRWCNASSSHLHIHSKATTVQHAVAEFLEAKMQRRVASPSDWTRQTSLRFTQQCSLQSTCDCSPRRETRVDRRPEPYLSRLVYECVSLHRSCQPHSLHEHVIQCLLGRNAISLPQATGREMNAPMSTGSLSVLNVHFNGMCSLTHSSIWRVWSFHSRISLGARENHWNDRVSMTSFVSTVSTNHL